MARKGKVGKKATKGKDSRPIRWRKYPHLFLIVCEDEKTEPYYFKQFIRLFPEETVFLRAIGTGRSSLGVVEKSETERQILESESNKVVDEVWVVFDKDDAEKSPGNTVRFKQAFQKAKELEHDVAYSNEVFELWLLLHLSDITVGKPIARQEIYLKINDISKSLLPEFNYEHGNTNIIDLIVKFGDENQAIKRAERILSKQGDKPPIDANPSTTVHILIKRLRELIEYYSYEP